MESVLEKLWSEPALMAHLSLTKDQLAELRAQGLPVIRANLRTRLYRDDAIYEFLVARETAERRQPRKREE